MEQNWRGLKWTAFAIGNFENLRQAFFKFKSVYTKMSFTQLEHHSQLLCGHDFANESTSLYQFDA